MKPHTQVHQTVMEALSKRCYVSCENHLSSGRLTIGFETLSDAQEAAMALLSATKLLSVPMSEGDDREWKSIGTVPINVPVDTCGIFMSRAVPSEIKMIRRADDYIASNSPYPLTAQYFDYEGGVGSYTRTHWRPVPSLPNMLVK